MERNESQGHMQMKSFHKETAYLVTSTPRILKDGATLEAVGEMTVITVMSNRIKTPKNLKQTRVELNLVN